MKTLKDLEVKNTGYYDRFAYVDELRASAIEDAKGLIKELTDKDKSDCDWAYNMGKFSYIMEKFDLKKNDLKINIMEIQRKQNRQLKRELKQRGIEWSKLLFSKEEDLK